VGESRSNWQVFQLLAQSMGFDDPFFSQTAEELMDALPDRHYPLWHGVDTAPLREGRPVRLNPGHQGGRYGTPSGRIEILNPRQEHTLPRWLPTHGEGDGYPLRLMTAPTPYCLNSSFNEQPELRQAQEGMLLLMNPADAASRGVGDGDPVTAANALGEVLFTARLTERVPAGVVVAEGVWWMAHVGGRRTVNALTSQRLTDQGKGSTFYDNGVEVRRLGTTEG
jgi:anaerobic selenocysteine-containing dehydrogenase